MDLLTATPRRRSLVLAGAVGWLLAALTIAVGGAGLVAGSQHLPGDATRPELTWQADQAVTTALHRLEPSFATLGVAVNSLGDDARTALADLVARDEGQLAQDLQQGNQLADRIGQLVGTLQPELERVPYVDQRDALGVAAGARLAAAQTALAAAERLPALWHSLAADTAPAVEVTSALLAHDQLAFAAVRDGAAGRYAQALAELAQALAELATATRIRDQLAQNVDVSTLGSWIERNTAYDAALQRLYTAAQDAGGRTTPAVQDALAAVRQAQAYLPPDTRALVVIMGDLAQGGLNQTAIAIEQARGDLAAAVTALH